MWTRAAALGRRFVCQAGAKSRSRAAQRSMTQRHAAISCPEKSFVYRIHVCNIDMLRETLLDGGRAG